MRLILSCTRVLVVGDTSVAREREGEGSRLEVSCLS
jgi:RNase P subunit RPR2